MEKYTKYVITTYMGGDDKAYINPFCCRNAYDNIGVYELHGYSDEDSMYDELSFSYVSINKMLDVLTHDNKYDIQIDEITLGKDKKYKAKTYSIPCRVGCRQVVSEAEIREMQREAAATISVSYVKCRRSTECFAFCNRVTISRLIRTYVIEAANEFEVVYCDRNGRRADSFGRVHFADWQQAKTFMKNTPLCIYNAFEIRKVYKDARELGAQ